MPGHELYIHCIYIHSVKCTYQGFIHRDSPSRKIKILSISTSSASRGPRSHLDQPQEDLNFFKFPGGAYPQTPVLPYDQLSPTPQTEILYETLVTYMYGASFVSMPTVCTVIIMTEAV